MRQFDIATISSPSIGEAHPDRNTIRAKIDNLNKPKGSLGHLEELAMQICMIQNTLTPALNSPHHLLFGSDHGIEREGVSVSPREITWQQMINFTHGGGGVNMFCRQHGFMLRLIDVGVDYDLRDCQGIIDRKIAHGTANFLYGPAMSEEQFDIAIATGAEQVDACAGEGCNVICIGEMGIANTSPSSIWMSIFGNIPLDECIGAGAGLDSPGIKHKREVLAKAVERFKGKGADCKIQSSEYRVQKSDCHLRQLSCPKNNNTSALHTQNSELHNPNSDIERTIRYFGGFEMVAAIGAMLRAAERRFVILIDGFIMTACALAASRLYPAVTDYMIFGHCGDESGHRRMLDIMGAKPLLSLGLRLGEGTGALCAYPIVDSAVRMINEMNNFDNANITKYF